MKTRKVGIIDYGAGNLASVEKAVDYAGGKPCRVKSAEDIVGCERIILPGVGAAGEALGELKKHDLMEPLTEAVRQKGVPFLGICLGMQLLADDLNEFGTHKGLGWISGKVVHLSQLTDEIRRVPHMGWNAVNFKDHAKNFAVQVDGGNYFYFAHSYTLCVGDPATIAATVNYGVELIAAIKHENIFATQFHPEKSQVNGERLIQSFLQWKP